MDMNKLLKEHPVFTEHDALKTVFSPLKSLGINYFGHVRMNRSHEISLMASNPEFLKCYISKKFYNYGMHQLEDLPQERYLLSDAITHKGKTKEVYETLAQFDHGHLFSIIQSSNGQWDFFHFGSTVDNQSVSDQYFTQLPALKSFISYYQDKLSANKSLKQKDKFLLSLDTKNSGFYIEEPAIKAAIDTPTFQDVNRIYFGDTYLTKKEFKCLHWLASGKTREETALILNISPRTVKAHIENAKAKLHCYNQFQLGMAYKQLQAYTELLELETC